MSRRRGCLLVVGVAAVVLLGAAVAAFRARNPEALRGAAERQLTALAGEPVSIGRLSVSLFPVPAVTGRDVRVLSAGAGRAQAVSVRAIRILPQWRTLLSRPVVVDAVEIEGLTLMARRDRERRWILPGATTATARSPRAAPPAVPGLPGGGTAEARRIGGGGGHQRHRGRPRAASRRRGRVEDARRAWRVGARRRCRDRATRPLGDAAVAVASKRGPAGPVRTARLVGSREPGDRWRCAAGAHDAGGARHGRVDRVRTAACRSRAARHAHGDRARSTVPAGGERSPSSP